MFYVKKGGGISTINNLNNISDLTEIRFLEKTTIAGRYWTANQNAKIQK